MDIKLRVTKLSNGDHLYTLDSDRWDHSVDVTDVVAFGETGPVEGTDGGFKVTLVFSGDEVTHANRTEHDPATCQGCLKVK